MVQQTRHQSVSVSLRSISQVFSRLLRAVLLPLAVIICVIVAGHIIIFQPLHYLISGVVMNLFARTFMAPDDTSTRRAINILLREKIHFAIVPNKEIEGAVISVPDEGFKSLKENGLID
jgi:hypothetical protein